MPLQLYSTCSFCKKNHGLVVPPSAIRLYFPIPQHGREWMFHKKAVPAQSPWHASMGICTVCMQPAGLQRPHEEGSGQLYTLHAGTAMEIVRLVSLAAISTPSKGMQRGANTPRKHHTPMPIVSPVNRAAFPTTVENPTPQVAQQRSSPQALGACTWPQACLHTCLCQGTAGPAAPHHTFAQTAVHRQEAS